MHITHLISIYGRGLHKSIEAVLDSRLQIQQFTLLVPMRCKLEAIQEILQRRNIEARFIRISNLESPGMLKQGFELALSSPFAHAGLTALNLSGANPVAASLGTQIFRARKLPILSIATHSDTLIWLSVAGGTPAPQQLNLENHLGLAEVLKIHGIDIINSWQTLKTRQPQWDAIAPKLLDEAQRAPGSFAQFTDFCRRVASPKLTTGPIPQHNNAIQSMIRKIVDGNLGNIVTQEGGTAKLHLKSASTVNVLSGGWLEHLVMMAAEKLHAEGLIEDAACGVKLDIGGGAYNELDGLLLAGGRIFVIECKARKGTSQSGKSGIGPDTIYKIDSIRAIREFEATPILVTLATPGEAEMLRLQQEGIHSLSGQSLRDIHAALRRLISPHHDTVLSAEKI